MKITVSQLRRIIKEEVEQVVKTQGHGRYGRPYGGGYDEYLPSGASEDDVLSYLKRRGGSADLEDMASDLGISYDSLIDVLDAMSGQGVQYDQRNVYL